MTGVIYTETVVHSASEQFAGEAPYQLVIVTLSSGGRVTARVAGGDRVAIGDGVTLDHDRDGIHFFRKTAAA